VDHQAFAQLLGNYGEFVGAIAVVATLAYLARQIKQNTQATRATLDCAIRSDFNRLHELIMSDSDMLELANRLGDPDVDFRAKSFANWYLNRFANVETALEADILPREDFDAWKADFARQLQLFPGLVPHMKEQLDHYPEWGSKRSLYEALGHTREAQHGS